MEYKKNSALIRAFPFRRELIKTLRNGVVKVVIPMNVIKILK